MTDSTISTFNNHMGKNALNCLWGKKKHENISVFFTGRFRITMTSVVVPLQCFDNLRLKYSTHTGWDYFPLIFPSLGLTHFTSLMSLNSLICNFILEIIEVTPVYFIFEVITNVGKQGYDPVISVLSRSYFCLVWIHGTPQ